ncbi:hypothetical protein GILI108418_05085 [Gillisia limnaea]|uniref:Uncharacterized protein n=2 Tax=Gillisia TaxID=244698 RepID=H2BTS3_GILLR|nr:hypothetical protein Gilli_2056 [Gillisia limnaea DSM 15749]
MQFQQTHQRMKDTHAQMQQQVEAKGINNPDLLEEHAQHEVKSSGRLLYPQSHPNGNPDR